MATKVQTKTYIPGSMMDLNNGLCNGMWDLYSDDRISGSEKSQFYDTFFMWQTMDGYPGYAKEQTRQTILKQESIFRHQLQELHRLYRRQRDLMNKLTMKEHYNFSKYTLTEFRSLSSKHSTTQRTVIDLELPPDVDEDNEGKHQTVCNLRTGKGYNLADLNVPIQVEEASFTVSLSDKLEKQDLSTNLNSGLGFLSKISQQDLKEREGRIGYGHIEVDRLEKEQLNCNLVDGKAKFHDNGFGNGVYSRQSNSLQAEPKKMLEHSRKRTLFGVELCERSHTPSFDSSQSSSWDQNTSTHHHNHWLGSIDPLRQIPEKFPGSRLVNNSNSRLMTSSTAGVPYQNGEELQEKQNVMDGQKNDENLEKKLPPWLITKPNFICEQTKGKETGVYQMNLDSLQNHSQQFFKKAEMTKVETDNSQGIMKILGVPIIDENSRSFMKDNGKSNCRSDSRHHIDLNMSYEEEEAPPSTPHIPESVVKIATMEIDLEAPAVLESETEDTPSKLSTNDVLMIDHDELVKVATEAIMSMSSTEQPCQPAPPLADTLLWWFAEVIESCNDVEKDSGNLDKNEEFIPEGMDDFEYMTLKLQETEEDYYSYNKPMIIEENEEEEGLSSKRTARKGQGKRGRPRKDFQRDVLPGIVSLSRREVTEDLQTFEEAFAGVGVSWQSRLSKRKAGGKNGRGRRRLAALSPSCTPPAVVEQSGCREVALEEKSLSGWGKRTRRLPRQRCQNGGGSHQSLALKC